MGGEQADVAAKKIDHVFVVFLENEPFDRLFADYPGADGDRNQKHITSDRPWWAPVFEPTHGVPSWRFRHLWGYRFFRGKYGPKDHPLYWRWARDYVLADRHRTQRGPSTPNHVQLWAATSDGLTNNPGNPYPIRVMQALLGGTKMSHEPPYDVPTVPNRLEEKGISWAAYGEGDFDMYTQLRDPSNPGHARNSYPTSRFAQDAKAGHLASVNWVFNDDTDAQGGVPGMEWVGSVIESIKNAPGNLWERSAILLTWDDWGGFYDHVQPVKGEAPPDFPQGGRVPLLVISPYAKSGLVYHEPTIHTSIPAFIEKLFGLEPLNAVDAAADDLMRCFDFSQQPLPAPVTRTQDVDVAALEAMVPPMPKRSLMRRVLHLPAKVSAPTVAAPQREGLS